MRAAIFLRAARNQLKHGKLKKYNFTANFLAPLHIFDSTENYQNSFHVNTFSTSSDVHKASTSTDAKKFSTLADPKIISSLAKEQNGKYCLANASGSNINYWNAISQLSKSRLSALVVCTTSAGFFAFGAPISYTALCAASIGTAFCASSASTWNQIFEVERDAKMKRTRNRPLPAGVISTRDAKILGTATAVMGGSLLLAGTDIVTASLGVGNIVLYSGLYTYLKPRSEMNTWVGALVGAIPPVMGWTAAGGSIFDLEALLLGGTLFLWQFPHFFALSWMHRVDYARGGFEMVPVNDPNGDRTSALVTRYSLYLSTLPVIASVAGVTSAMFAIEGLLLNGYALHLARRFAKDRSNANARKVFLMSLWYLPCWMMLFILHSKTWKNENDDKLADENELSKMASRVITSIRQNGTEACLHTHIAAISKDKECGLTVVQNQVESVKESGLIHAEEVGITVAGVLDNKDNHH